jgi:cytochrome c6
MKVTIAIAMLALTGRPALSQASTAAALYKSKCQVCHGASGKGDTAAGKKMGAKDFHSPDVAKMSDTQLFDITKKGREKMPGYDKKLTDNQIKSLVKYIRSLK